MFGALSHFQSLRLVGWVGFVFLLSCLVLDWLWCIFVFVFEFFSYSTSPNFILPKDQKERHLNSQSSLEDFGILFPN